MTTDVKSVTDLSIIQDVVNLFEENNIHHVPVTNHQDQVIGIVSRTDIDKITTGASLFKNHDKKELNTLIYRTKWVSEIMTKDVVCLDCTDSVQDAYSIFKENHFRALPVVEAGKLIGIVTPIDLIDYFINTWY